MDSSSFDENNENHPLSNRSFSIDGPAPPKKRKLSMGGSSLFEIQLNVLRFENDSLKKLIEEMENNNEYENENIMLKNSVKILEATNANLQSTNEQKELQYKAEIDSLKSASDGYLSKIKDFEDKNQALNEKVAELNDEILSMKTIKSEIKDSVENERETFQATIDKLNAENNDLQNKINNLEEINLIDQQKIHDYDLKIEIIKQQKEANEKEIKELQEQLSSTKDQFQVSEQQIEKERQSFHKNIDKMEAELRELQEKNNELEAKTKSSMTLISDYKIKIEDLEVIAVTEKILFDVEMNEKQKIFNEKSDAMKAKIHALKEKNTKLEQTIAEAKTQFDDQKTIYKKLENDNANLFLKKEQLQKQFNHVRNENNENLNKIELMKAENDVLTKKIADLVNEKQVLQNSIDEYKKTMENMKQKESEPHIIYVSDVIDDNSKIDFSLMSCKTKELMVGKIEGVENGIYIYCSLYPEEFCFMKYSDFFNTTCFKFRLRNELVFRSPGKNLNEIVSRTTIRSIRKLHLCEQKITCENFQKLVELNSIELCILEKVNISGGEVSPYPLYKILKELFQVKEFRYIPQNQHLPAETAQELVEKLQPFPDLIKFQLFDIPHDFDLKTFSGFVKKNLDACYLLRFGKLPYKYMKTKVQKNEKKLLNSLSSVESNIIIEYEKE